MALMQADVGKSSLTCSVTLIWPPVAASHPPPRRLAEVKIVKELRDNIKNRVNLEMMAAGYNKKRIVQAAVFEELVEMLTPARKPFTVTPSHLLAPCGSHPAPD